MAGALAFVVGALFGAALVNEHYEYYTTWGSMVAAATGSGVVGYQASLGVGGTPAGSAAGTDAGSRAGSRADSLLTQESRQSRQSQARHGARKPLASPPSPVLSALPSSDVPASVSIPRLALQAVRTTGTGRIVELLHGDRGDPEGWVYRTTRT